MVQEFMNATNQSVSGWNDETRLLRAKLIAEEAAETVAALGFYADFYVSTQSSDAFGPTLGDITEIHELPNPDDTEVIDGICDLIYVALGTVASMDINLDPHFIEVHRANMDKLAGPVREDGKQLKPNGWQGPDHHRILAQNNGQTD